MQDKNLITVAKIPYLMRSDLREFKQIEPYHDMRISDAIEDYRNDLERLGFRDFFVSRNGYDVSDKLDSYVDPGDDIAISIKHGIPVPAAIAAWVGTTIGVSAATASTMIAGLVNTIIMVGVGMIVQAFLPKPTQKGAYTQSPTYGFENTNPTKEGNPVPVVYGKTLTTPQILNTYRRVAGEYDYNMWVYILMALHAGDSSTFTSASGVYVGDELLTSYSDYYWNTTSGHYFQLPSSYTMFPSTSDEFALADKFIQVHHDRSFDHLLKKGSRPSGYQYAYGYVTVNVLPTVGDTLTVGGFTWTFTTQRYRQFEIPRDADVNLFSQASMIADYINADASASFTAQYISNSDFTGYTDYPEIKINPVTAGATGNSTVLSTTSSMFLTAFSGGGDPAGTNVNCFQFTTDNKCRYVRLIATFPQGKVFYDDNGDPLQMDVVIEYNCVKKGQDPSVYGTWTPYTFVGKGSQAVRKELLITFDEEDYYDVYIIRTTNDDPEPSTKQISTMYISSVDEITDKTLYYPGIKCGIFGIKATDRVSQQVPKITVVSDASDIYVRNWTNTAEVKMNVSNPAWAAYGAFTDTVTGRGISPTKLIKSAWEEWGEWCDGQVYNAADRQTRKRAEINIVFDESGAFNDACLRHIEDVGRAKIIQIGSYWSVVVDKPDRHPAYTFSAGNMVPGTFEWQGMEDNEKIDAIEVTYYDREANWEERSVLHKASWYETLDKEPRVAQIVLRGCTLRDQAKREAILRMQRTEFITRQGKLETYMSAAAIERGDVINIIHPTNRYGFGGRLTQDLTGATRIYFDQYINMTSSIYTSANTKIFLVDPDGVQYEFFVSGPFNTNTNFIDIITTTGKYYAPDEAGAMVEYDASSYTGNKLDVFAIGRPNNEKLRYQVTNKKFIPGSGDRLPSVEIEFVEWVEDIYYYPVDDHGIDQYKLLDGTSVAI